MASTESGEIMGYQEAKRKLYELFPELKPREGN